MRSTPLPSLLTKNLGWVSNWVESDAVGEGLRELSIVLFLVGLFVQ